MRPDGKSWSGRRTRSTDTVRRPNAWTLAAVIFVAAVLVNYPWELAQAPLFRMEGWADDMWRHCLIAALGDGVLVLFLYASGCLLYGNRLWFAAITRRRYGLLILAGALLGVLIEWFAVHRLGRWQYGGIMPRLPGVDIGLVPVIQMMFLPPLIFLAVRLALQYLPRGAWNAVR